MWCDPQRPAHTADPAGSRRWTGVGIPAAESLSRVRVEH
jgi:hypothetical protein